MAMSIRGAERSERIARRAEQAVQRCTAERRKPFGGNLAEGDPKGEKRAGLKPIHTVDRAFIPAKELQNRFRLDTALVGESYNTDIEDILKCVRRCAERNEVFVLTSHGIAPDAKDINMKTEWLERILATAKESGVAVIGFDEL